MKIKSLLISITAIMMLVSSVVYFTGCNKLENVTNSSSKLIVDLITGRDLLGNEESTTVFSDVITSSGSVFNDVGTATLSAVVLNPTQASGTFYQDIIVDQIDIEYSRTDRTDGSNIEGVDVPFSFSQKVNARILVGASIELGFVLVQHVAKRESPLVELILSGQEHVLKLEAKITFHGKDVAGNRVEPAVGYISVWCANFADED
jgi:hypothetical protein